MLDVTRALERVCVLPIRKMRFVSASQVELADSLPGFLYNLPIFSLLVLWLLTLGV